MLELRGRRVTDTFISVGGKRGHSIPRYVAPAVDVYCPISAGYSGKRDDRV